MKCIFLIVAAVVFISCNSGSDQHYQPEDDAAETDSIHAENGENAISEETITIVNGSDFSKYAKAKLPQFDWKNFSNTRFWKQDTMRTTPFAPETSYFDSYGRFLKYSPDSSKFIDLDSYNIEIHNVNGRLVGNDQGPDTEVSLVDVAKKQRSRLLFQGPGNSIDDAAWIDNDHLVLIGLQQNEQSTASHPVVYTFDLKTDMVYMYELEDEKVAASLKNYSRKERLKSVTMRGEQ